MSLVRESLDNIITSAPGDHDKPYQFGNGEQMCARFDRFEWNRLWAAKDSIERLLAGEYGVTDDR